MSGEIRKRKRRHEDDDEDDIKVAVPMKHLDRAGPALGTRTVCTPSTIL